MKAKELAAFFASLPPNTDVKIASCVDGKPVVDSPMQLVALWGSALIQTEGFVQEMERRAQEAEIAEFKPRIVQ